MLEVREVSKAYGGIQAVAGCSFSVDEGSITGLIGPNGAGKTTAFDIISGIVSPDEGNVLLEGIDVTDWMPHRITRRGVSRTFQITRDLGAMTVLENMVVGSPTTGWRGLLGSRILEREEDRAMELLRFVGIDRLAFTSAESLSYGQKKLLEFASVLMPEPKLIMLDEPAGGVNPALLERIMDHIQQLNDQGLTFLIVEHNMDVVMTMCDTIVVMAHGEVLTTGTPEVIREDDTVLDAYLGRA
ncbi:MAG TPA: ABC transporter ATP-binding protein [Acidimicrobiia bacterium]|nr:ABC transporter ATP-binding protein [Acidimicrobiia bacterium]